MLSWTQRSDGWYSNGFRIALAGPHRWLLLEAKRDTPGVGLEEQALAVARSLTECKREAELVAAKHRRGDIQRRNIATLLLVLASTPLLLGNSSLADGVIILVALGLATRSITVLLGTLMPRALGEQHEVFYQ